MTEIRSRDNARYKALRRLVQSSRERRRAGVSVLDGVHLTAAYCESVGSPDQILVSRAGLENPEVKAILKRHEPAAPTMLADALFKDISSVATPTGIMAIVKTPAARALPPDPGACVILEGLQDPGNLGSILRSCAAAGIRHVLLSRGSVHAWSPRALRAGMGAHFRLQIYEETDVVGAARRFPGTVIATCASGREPLFGVDLTGKVALAFGNEGSGLTRALRAAAHAEVAIPMAGATESLNVAAAVAVCLFERSRQLRAMQMRGAEGGAKRQ